MEIDEISFNRYAITIDRFLAQQAAWLLKHSYYFGCYLSARKSETTDHRAINIQEFSHP